MHRGSRILTEEGIHEITHGCYLTWSAGVLGRDTVSLAATGICNTDRPGVVSQTVSSDAGYVTTRTNRSVKAYQEMISDIGESAALHVPGPHFVNGAVAAFRSGRTVENDLVDLPWRGSGGDPEGIPCLRPHDTVRLQRLGTLKVLDGILGDRAEDAVRDQRVYSFVLFSV